MTFSVQNLPINQYTALGHQQTWPVLENGTSSTFFFNLLAKILALLDISGLQIIGISVVMNLPLQSFQFFESLQFCENWNLFSH